MNIHEYQAKELLAKFGVPVPAGYAAMSVEEAVDVSKKLPGPLYVVKAQIHAGGRGKGKFKELPEGSKGGVRLAKTEEEVRHAAAGARGRRALACPRARAAGRGAAHRGAAHCGAWHNKYNRTRRRVGWRNVDYILQCTGSQRSAVLPVVTALHC